MKWVCSSWFCLASLFGVMFEEFAMMGLAVRYREGGNCPPPGRRALTEPGGRSCLWRSRVIAWVYCLYRHVYKVCTVQTSQCTHKLHSFYFCTLYTVLVSSKGSSQNVTELSQLPGTACCQPGITFVKETSNFELLEVLILLFLDNLGSLPTAQFNKKKHFI